jgi:hypothetical protein
MDRFIDLDQLSTTLVIAVQATLLIFFIISPMMGGIWARFTRNRTTHVINIALCLLGFNLLFVALSKALESQDALSDHAATIISLALSSIFSIGIGATLIWIQSRDSDPIADERANLDRDNIPANVFEEKRRERLKKSAKRRK